MKQRLFFLLFFCVSFPLTLHSGLLHMCSCCQDDVQEQQNQPHTQLITRTPTTSRPNNPITLTTIRDAYHEIESADSSTLALFDIDDTILESDSPPFQARFFSNADPENNFFYEFEFFWRREKNLTWYTRFLKDQQRQLVEPEMADFIKKLQKKGATVLAISAFSAGESGEIADLHEFRHEELTRNGIDLDKPLPFDTCKFKELCAGLHPKKIDLKRGIVSSAAYSKGILISWIIGTMHTAPNKIIFFDDNFLKHKEVLAENFHIPLVAYLYTAARIVCPEKHSLNKTIARAQLDYIYRDDRYVSYKEAAERVAQASLTTLMTKRNPLLPEKEAHNDHASTSYCSQDTELKPLTKSDEV